MVLRPRIPEVTLTGEFAIIERLRGLLAGPAGPGLLGDDAAVVPPGLGSMLLTADAVVAGVHADLGILTVADMGWKAMAANVSDIAAMGATPRYALVTVVGPLGEVDTDLLFDGVLAAADAYGCTIAGGDLSAAPTLMVAVAMVGEVEVGGRPPVRRSGAAAGDTLFVTGPLGGSAAGLALLRAGRGGEAPDLASAHRRPRARVAEGLVARGAGASAMIDVSDGLAADLRHLADESGVGVVVDHVPVAIGVSRVSDEPEALALGGGEDYELLFAAPDPETVRTAFVDAGLGTPLVVGRCTADPSERQLRDGDLPVLGWEHSW